MSITKNLGHATAYGYAKSKGYTGTEEEFAELMASYASVGQTAVEAAEAAVQAKTDAQSANTDAQAAKGAASASAAAAAEYAQQALAGAGTPLVASTAAAMTDQTKIYVYLGSETGYTNGDWYYFDGSDWTSGGVYNAQALETDTTLTLPGRAADARTVGDRFAADEAVINTSHAYVDYNYAEPYHQDANPSSSSSASKMSIDRNHQIITLDLHTTITADVRIKISGSVSPVANANGVKAWTTGLTLKTGHVYAAKVRILSGSCMSGGQNVVPSVSVYPAGLSSSAGTGTRSEDEKEFVRVFTAAEDTEYNLALYVGSGYTEINAAKLLVVLEDQTESEIANITADLDGIVPRHYVVTEADRVAEKVRNVQTPTSLTFVAISDMHYLVNAAQTPTIKAALQDMRDGVLQIAEQTHIDFYCSFGDVVYRLNNDGSTYTDGLAETIAQTKLINACFKNNPQIRMVGNHDPNAETAGESLPPNLMNAFTGLYSDLLENDPDHPAGVYGFRDFAGRKLRLIVLNTSYYTADDVPRENGNIYNVGDAQTYWLARHLDLSDKQDAQDWQIIVMSHVPLDNPTGTLLRPVSLVFKAYLNGETWSSGSYSYSFANGRNAAKIAAYINGHAHMYAADHLKTDYSSSSGKYETALQIPKLYVPNALPERDDPSMDGVTYTKTPNTAQSTAFQMITLDLENGVIYAHHYGAGIDIVLHYEPQTASEASPLTLATDLSSPAWDSMDENVATVSDGAVTPAESGNVIIFAKSETDDTIEAWNIHTEA